MSTSLPGGAELALPADPLEQGRQRVRLAYWLPLVAVLGSDLLTKSIAASTLALSDPPRPVLGEVLRFALAYNPGIAFGWNIGPASRPVFSILAFVVLLVLYRLYRSTASGDTSRALALGLICGGAIGNLADRIRSPLGVVDFIDIGIGNVRWWTFNLADVGVGLGALLLIQILWRQDDADPAAGLEHSSEP